MKCTFWECWSSGCNTSTCQICQEEQIRLWWRQLVKTQVQWELSQEDWFESLHSDLCQSLGLFGACAEPWLHLRSLFWAFRVIIAHKWEGVKSLPGAVGTQQISCWVIRGAALVLCAVSHFSTNVWINLFVFLFCSVSFWCLRLPVFLVSLLLHGPCP